MYKQEGTKVAIIGAGAVGSTTAFAIAMQQLCSELVLIDVNKDKAMGEALDISHGLPFIGDMYIHAGDYSDVKDADCIAIAKAVVDPTAPAPIIATFVPSCLYMSHMPPFVAV